MRLLYRFVAVHPAVHETLILVVARADTVVVAVEAVRVRSNDHEVPVARLVRGLFDPREFSVVFIPCRSSASRAATFREHRRESTPFEPTPGGGIGRPLLLPFPLSFLVTLSYTTGGKAL